MDPVRGTQINHRFDGTARADILRQIEGTIQALQTDFAAFHAAVFKRDKDFGDCVARLGSGNGPSNNTRAHTDAQAALAAADQQIDLLMSAFATNMELTQNQIRLAARDPNSNSRWPQVAIMRVWGMADKFNLLKDKKMTFEIQRLQATVDGVLQRINARADRNVLYPPGSNVPRNVDEQVRDIGLIRWQPGPDHPMNGQTFVQKDPNIGSGDEQIDSSSLPAPHRDYGTDPSKARFVMSTYQNKSHRQSGIPGDPTKGPVQGLNENKTIYAGEVEIALADPSIWTETFFSELVASGALSVPFSEPLCGHGCADCHQKGKCSSCHQTHPVDYMRSMAIHKVQASCLAQILEALTCRIG